MNKSLSLFLTALLVALVAGCGSPADNPDADTVPDSTDDVAVIDANADDTADSLDDVDSVAPDDGPDGHSQDVADVQDSVSPDVAGDIPRQDADDVSDAADVAVDAVDPGEFGWPCSADNECLDGPCVLTDQGRICTAGCTYSLCPDGFSCVSYSSGGLTPALVCMPEFLNVCTPCDNDGDCNLGLASTAGMTCRVFGRETGSFCVPPCVDACPDGYECQASGLDDGKSWCIPPSGECACSWLATEAGATTSCTVGSAGIETRCAGARTCGLGGITECSGARPDGEKCNGIDDDCDGITDEAGAVDCTVFYFDLDDDGEGIESVARCYCAAQGAYRAEIAGDCDDSNPAIRTSAVEECDEIDNDCDSVTDEPGATRCRDYFQDLDGDGVGGDVGALCLCRPSDDYPLTAGGDCDDGNMFIAPGVDEACNGVDDDCDGTSDLENADGCLVWYRDGDGDTYGDGASSKCLCMPAGKYTAGKVGDCNDIIAGINPGATEVCNGLDDNCDAIMDPEGASGCSPWFADRDDDGWGVLFDSRCLCRAGDVYTTKEVGDCDDMEYHVNPEAWESCDNNIDEDCDGIVNEPGALWCDQYFADVDQDGIGNSSDSNCLCAPVYPYTSIRQGDCDDLSGSVSPTSLEVCGNAVDDDCDAMTDEAGCSGCTIFYLDVDRDGFGVSGVSACLSGPDEVSGYVARVARDCADENNQIHPGAAEICNGLDDNCDNATDPDNSDSCIVFYYDYDGDGFGLTSNSRCLCAPVGNYSAIDDGDCDDLNPKVGGGAESCNGIDDNCNGRIDEEDAAGCLTWYLDDDGDGVGVVGASRCLCTADGRYSARVSGDCDDANVSVRPGVSDTCNGVDDDCDGMTDPENATGCQSWYRDVDGDGFGVDGQGKCLCASTSVYVTKKGGDCNDAVRVVSPAGIEYCNSVDDNCDGATDPAGTLGCDQYFADRDGDGWGNSNDSACLCEPAAPWVETVAGDCDDSSASIGPGGKEACGGYDEDCDGQTDEYGATGCTFYYLDTDRDGWGIDGSGLCSCAAEGIRDAIAGGDCNDSNQALNPSAAEVCNGVDDNCDGTKDPANATGCVAYMVDRDSDGFGVAGNTMCLCAPTYPYTSLMPGDCDDTRALSRPGRVETCDGFDDDCDGLTDTAGSQGCRYYYVDADGDGYAVPGSPVCLCAPTAPWLLLDAEGDCDDTDPDANKGETEACDGFDNDCDGVIDEDNTVDCLTRYLDADADGWGVLGNSVCRCAVRSPYTATKTGDCDDARFTVAPGKSEVCDGLDNNCDGLTDPQNTNGCMTFYMDYDRDGYGIASDSKCLCASSGTYTATSYGDCNDYSSAISPGKKEICLNDIDDNCSGAQDEDGATGCRFYFKDVDTDGFGDSSDGRCLCGADLTYKVTNGTDCCDRDDKAYPNSTVWQNTIDRCNSWDYNCDGAVLKRYNLSGGGCDGWGIGSGCDLQEGWTGGVAACGVRTTYAISGCGYCGFLWLTCCDAGTEQRTQMCL